MLNLDFAPSADLLVSLAESRIRRAWADPFDPPAVIVPNPAVGKWLTVKLAEPAAFGCVANARMTTLEKFLWNALAPDADMSLLDAGKMAQVICAALDEEILGEDIYAPLKNYLYRTDNNQIDALKRVQLSTRIAQQFLEYEYNRPSVWNEEAGKWKNPLGIDAQWLLRKKYFGGREHEAWQMDLYLRVHKCFAGNESTRYLSLPHLYRHRREECAKGKRAWCDVGTNQQIILFGVSKISHFHRNTLVEISQMNGVDMHVFLTNPCAEFWEDVNTSRKSFTPRRQWRNDSPNEEAGIKPVKPEYYNEEKLDLFADEKEDHPLLKQWGSAGKENIFLWCPQAEWNFEYHGDMPAHPKTLLQSIQNSLLLRKKDLDITTVSGDLKNEKSLQILACPDISREVEEIRELILDMAYDGKIDSFNNIAVYMPDPNKYLPHIQRVFGAYPQNHPLHIPFTILGASSGSSVAARAVFTLLNIIGGNFNRALIFELFRNPIVMASRKFSSSNVAMWERWAEEFGMFRGFNAEQRRSMGDMGDAVTDEHTFERGMRMVMASIGVDEDGTMIDTIISTDIAANTSYIKTSAETFLALLKELNELSTLFTTNNTAINICEAVEIIKKAIWAWIGNIPADGSVDNSKGETRVRREVFDGLDGIMLQHTVSGRANIPFDEFIALARGCVPEELVMPSSAWSGVTFAPLRVSMVLPHRAIFVLGLGATEFPGTNEKGSWDLLSHKRIVGDSDRVRDNRFAFLELLHAAKECLILSYRARDLQKDELLQPSSVIPELEEYLISRGLTDGGENSRNCLVRREIPWVVHESLDTAWQAGRKHGTWDETQRELAIKAMGERVQYRHDKKILTDAGDQRENKLFADDGNQYNTNLKDLKRFFDNPLEYHLCRTLGVVNDYETGDMAVTDEPIDSGYRLYELRKKVWIATLNMIFSSAHDSQDPALTIADKTNKIYDDHIDTGQAPEGHICRMEREELLNWAKECAEAAPKLKNYFPKHQLVEKSDFSVDCNTFTINGYHALTLIPKDLNNKSLQIGILSFDKNGKVGDNLAIWLEGLMAWMTEIRSGDAHPINLVALNHGDTPDIQLSYMNMDSGKLPDIENWMSGILSQMLIEKRCEHLPFKIVAEIIKPRRPKKGEAVESFGERLQRLTIQSLKDKLFGENGYKTYTEAFELTDAKPPKMNNDELRQLVDFRYAPILGGWIHE